MKILRVVEYPLATLYQKLRTVRLRGFNRHPVYEHARFELVRGSNTNDIVPAQNYVLQEGVNRTQRLWEELRSRDIDAFQLEGYLVFWVPTPDGGEESIPLLPPIVEESFEEHDTSVNLLNDGMHRVYAARSLQRPINYVRVSGLDSNYPYYAYPIEGGWNAVQPVLSLEGVTKKRYRNPSSYKDLFRDFNEVFEGVQKQR
jgi:hypothetical protein